MQQTSKWEKHLPYLVCIIQSLKTMKIQGKYQHTGAILDNRATVVSYAHVLVLWKDPKSLPLGARSRECDNKRTKN